MADSGKSAVVIEMGFYTIPLVSSKTYMLWATTP